MADGLPSVAERVIEIADLEPIGVVPTMPAADVVRKIGSASGRTIHVSSPTALRFPVPGSDRPTSQLFAATHLAFSSHRDLVLSPEVLWYCVAFGVAEHIRQNPKRFAELFGAGPERRTITVRDDSLSGGPTDDWGHTIALFAPKLREAVGPDLLDLFLPEFSTSRRDDELTLLVAFMHAAAPYFHYRVRSFCGIPRVVLRGSAADWNLILERLPRLSRSFPLLEAWLAALSRVVEVIHATARGDDAPIRFWDSLYKDERRSGGPDISGWLASLVVRPDPAGRSGFEPPDQLHWDEVPAHWVSVPFIWELPLRGLEIPMSFGGGILASSANDVLGPHLAWTVEAQPERAVRLH